MFRSNTNISQPFDIFLDPANNCWYLLKKESLNAGGGEIVWKEKTNNPMASTLCFVLQDVKFTSCF